MLVLILPIFMAHTKRVYGYNFVAPLMSLIYYFGLIKIMVKVLAEMFLSVLIQLLHRECRSYAQLLLYWILIICCVFFSFKSLNEAFPCYNWFSCIIRCKIVDFWILWAHKLISGSLYVLSCSIKFINFLAF